MAKEVRFCGWSVHEDFTRTSGKGESQGQQWSQGFKPTTPVLCQWALSPLLFILFWDKLLLIALAGIKFSLWPRQVSNLWLAGLYLHSNWRVSRPPPPCLAENPLFLWLLLLHIYTHVCTIYKYNPLSPYCCLCVYMIQGWSFCIVRWPIRRFVHGRG